MRAAKVQASLRICAVSPEPSLLTHTSSESRGTFRQKAKSLAPLNGWACAVKICHDRMLDDTNSLDGAQMVCCQHVKIPILILENHHNAKLKKNKYKKEKDRRLEGKTMLCLFFYFLCFVVMATKL